MELLNLAKKNLKLCHRSDLGEKRVKFDESCLRNFRMRLAVMWSIGLVFLEFLVYIDKTDTSIWTSLIWFRILWWVLSLFALLLKHVESTRYNKLYISWKGGSTCCNFRHLDKNRFKVVILYGTTACWQANCPFHENVGQKRIFWRTSHCPIMIIISSSITQRIINFLDAPDLILALYMM